MSTSGPGWDVARMPISARFATLELELQIANRSEPCVNLSAEEKWISGWSTAATFEIDTPTLAVATR
jgi:hypothetical protein